MGTSQKQKETSAYANKVRHLRTMCHYLAIPFSSVEDNWMLIERPQARLGFMRLQWADAILTKSPTPTDWEYVTPGDVLRFALKEEKVLNKGNTAKIFNENEPLYKSRKKLTRLAVKQFSSQEECLDFFTLRALEVKHCLEMGSLQYFFPCDLIKHTPKTLKKPDFKVGQRWLRRDGIEVVIDEVCEGEGLAARSEDIWYNEEGCAIAVSNVFDLIACYYEDEAEEIEEESFEPNTVPLAVGGKYLNRKGECFDIMGETEEPLRTEGYAFQGQNAVTGLRRSFLADGRYKRTTEKHDYDLVVALLTPQAEKETPKVEVRDEPQDKPRFQLKVGQEYRDGGGRIWTVKRECDALGPYAFWCVGRGMRSRFTEDGFFWSDRRDDDRNFVELIEDVPEEEILTPNGEIVPFESLRAGDVVYVKRDGEWVETELYENPCPSYVSARPVHIYSNDEFILKQRYDGPSLKEGQKWKRRDDSIVTVEKRDSVMNPFWAEGAVYAIPSYYGRREKQSQDLVELIENAPVEEKDDESASKVDGVDVRSLKPCDLVRYQSREYVVGEYKSENGWIHLLLEDEDDCLYIPACKLEGKVEIVKRARPFELKAGQKWVTRDGRTVRLEEDEDGDISSDCGNGYCRNNPLHWLGGVCLVGSDLMRMIQDEHGNAVNIGWYEEEDIPNQEAPDSVPVAHVETERSQKKAKTVTLEKPSITRADVHSRFKSLLSEVENGEQNELWYRIYDVFFERTGMDPLYECKRVTPKVSGLKWVEGQGKLSELLEALREVEKQIQEEQRTAAAAQGEGVHPNNDGNGDLHPQASDH